MRCEIIRDALVKYATASDALSGLAFDLKIILDKCQLSNPVQLSPDEIKELQKIARKIKKEVTERTHPASLLGPKEIHRDLSELTRLSLGTVSAVHDLVDAANRSQVAKPSAQTLNLMEKFEDNRTLPTSWTKNHFESLAKGEALASAVHRSTYFLTNYLNTTDVPPTSLLGWQHTNAGKDGCRCSFPNK